MGTDCNEFKELFEMKPWLMGEKQSSFDPHDKHGTLPSLLKKFYDQEDIHDGTVFGSVE